MRCLPRPGFGGGDVTAGRTPPPARQADRPCLGLLLDWRTSGLWSAEGRAPTARSDARPAPSATATGIRADAVAVVWFMSLTRPSMVSASTSRPPLTRWTAQKLWVA